jgi:hypothetical protein
MPSNVATTAGKAEGEKPVNKKEITKEKHLKVSDLIETQLQSVTKDKRKFTNAKLRSECQ